MEKLNHLIADFEARLRKEIQVIDATPPVRLYEPVGYSLSLGGKRLRPALMLHAASLFTDDLAKVAPAAIAIEVFHNFTLLHDDIMDRADLRRGIPTIHKKYGENTAILSGDAMSIMAFRYLAQTGSSKLPQLLDLFSTTALEVCEGQQYDMEFETRDDVTIGQYIEMIRLKTAVLIAAALKIGAILAGAPDREADLLYDYGINIGLAFQLQDDWLDVYGDEATFGKKIGGDILENKKTFLLLKALELSQGENQTRLQYWLDTPETDAREKIAGVTRIYTESGAAAEAQSMMKYYHDKALVCLSQLNLPKEDQSELVAFAGKVLSRVK